MHFQGLKDPKIQLFRQLQEEVQPSLGDPDIVLDSYIVSNTDYEFVKFWGPRPAFTDSHVVFQNDDDYLNVMFKKILE